MNTVVVIPTYNERQNVGPLIERLATLPRPVDLFFIDDGSPDGTGALLDALRDVSPRLRVMHRTGKLGLGSAYRQAFQALLQEPYERFITMDADLSHRPESVPDLVRVSTDADLVIGSRYCPGGATKNWPIGRRLLSSLANQLARGALGLTVKDATAGFRCYRRDLLTALNRVGVRSNGYAFQIEMVYYTQVLGFSLREVPILFEDRSRAQSKMSRSEVTSAIRTLLRLWRHRLSGVEALDQTKALAKEISSD